MNCSEITSFEHVMQKAKSDERWLSWACMHFSFVAHLKFESSKKNHKKLTINGGGAGGPGSTLMVSLTANAGSCGNFGEMFWKS